VTEGIDWKWERDLIEETARFTYDMQKAIPR